MLAKEGLSVVRNAIMMKELWSYVFNDSVKVDWSDLISDNGEKPFCQQYGRQISQMLNAITTKTLASKFMVSKTFSPGKLRDWLKTGLNLFQDTFEVIQTHIITHESINNTNALGIGIGQEDYQSLKASADTMMATLKEVIKNSDFDLIHNKAMSFVKVSAEDMIVPENQGQYEELESDQVTKELGWRLYFPKLYADTYNLGSQNGWCVDSKFDYSENVRSGKAFLVGIAPQGKYADKDATIEACEALLYVVFDDHDRMQSHQIMMSEHMSLDFSKKMPKGTPKKLMAQKQYEPTSGRYPMNEIIRLVREIRSREHLKRERAA
jgi:hypothetical protein